MPAAIDIREQIRAQARVLFPRLVAQYMALLPYSRQPREAFDIVITQLLAGPGGSFCALLVCLNNGQRSIIARGQATNDISTAMQSLLLTLIAAVRDHGGLLDTGLERQTQGGGTIVDAFTGSALPGQPLPVSIHYL